MLQQTTTEAVIPYYNRFLEKFPNIYTLSQATLDDVYKLWEGLGYYSRARNIHATAQIIMNDFNGVFPTTHKDVLSLKGIGPYTAGAICSIAYHMPLPAVDGNVLRIIARLYDIEENILEKRVNDEVTHIIQGLLDGINPSDFNQALMDLGATICRPKNPKCEICPISNSCIAFQTHKQTVLPIRITKTKKQDIHYVTGIVTYNDYIHIFKTESGLLSNLFQCPQFNVESPFSFIEAYTKEYGVTLHVVSHIKKIKHVFTHRTWYMDVYHFQLDQPVEDLIPINTLDQYAISTAHQKCLKAYHLYK